ncbi:RimK family alpha-L-glutamate ligase [Streptomyces sp. NBC_01431]|uniref:RimK family alpha-L-glutamate ligase n=1 Tax=Streptomyces sp. NBC_01431 TaxID=2903863 RepID=UPI002E352BBA|nr:RimK family alpha-L-glutamate ligase [Streptomyces sp. NBC_01431]
MADVVGSRTCLRARPADFWFVLGAGLHGRLLTERLSNSFTWEFGDRCAVVRSEELLLGVRGGRLTLHDLDGCELAAPRVAYARVWTPAVGTDREITLLRHLEAMGTVLLNPVDAVLVCLNKFWHLQQLALAGLAVPDTQTYADAPLEVAVRAAGLPEPCVVKAVRGHRGEQVFLAPDTAMLRGIQGSLNQDTPYLFQEYVAHSHGRDLRVVVVDGHAVAAQVRTAVDGDFRSNLALGGTATLCAGRYPHAEELAVRAAEVLGLGIAGVDLLFTPGGGFTICEVNANVGWHDRMEHLITPALLAACHARLSGTDRTAAVAR